MPQVFSRLLSNKHFYKKWYSLLLLLFVIIVVLFIRNITKKETAINVNHEEESDYLWDNSNVTLITLNGTSIKVTGSGASADGSKVTVREPGNYSFSGSLINGQVVVDTPDKGVVRLILNGANIHCEASAPIYIINADKTLIHLVEKKENCLSDGTSYTTVKGEPSATVFCKSDLTIFGQGKLTVTGNYQDGITSKDGLILKSGNITVSAVDDGIRGKDYLMLMDGTINVTSGGDGLKSDNGLSKSLGFVSIYKGDITITSGGDAIAAQTDIMIADGKFNLTSGGGSSKARKMASSKGIKALSGLTIEKGTFVISSADDALHTNKKMTINGGSYTLSSSDDALHADSALTVNAENLMVSGSREGFESHIISIKGGNIGIVSSDDAINATAGQSTGEDDKSFLYINGGNITLNASSGDAVDSNGSIVMTAGKLVAHGSGSPPEAAIDYNKTFIISGGLLIAAGPNSNYIMPPSNTSSQNSLMVIFKNFMAPGTVFRLEDSKGNEIVTFAPFRKYRAVMFSSPLLKQGSVYKIYSGGKSTGSLTDGLFSGGIYTPGVFYDSFEITGAVKIIH
ncbi:MAG TPA: carbohydrate-binding domain-containing protein [Prolixibacteraceae bacterium]|nr:carbohydrate-binding domain-containing protein [Prolixibacteraceae bacterium]